jgi:hypothetical protein
MLRTAVGILKLYQPKMEAGSYEEIMCHVSRLPQDISEADLFNCIASVTIDANTYNKAKELLRHKGSGTIGTESSLGKPAKPANLKLSDGLQKAGAKVGSMFNMLKTPPKRSTPTRATF